MVLDIIWIVTGPHMMFRDHYNFTFDIAQIGYKHITDNWLGL